MEALIILVPIYMVLGLLVANVLDDMTNRIDRCGPLVVVVLMLWPTVAIALPIMWWYEATDKYIIAKIKAQYKKYKRKSPLAFY